MRIFRVLIPNLLFLAMPVLLWGEPLPKEFHEVQRIQEENSRMLAETNLAVNQLRQEVQGLRGMIEETKYFFQQESEKNGKLLRDFDFRLTGIEERMLLHQKQLEELLTPKKGSSPKGGRQVEGEEADYKRALSEINIGNHVEAVKRFGEFLQKYPKSSLADNAQYWKGEALYAGKDFAGALVEFQKVIRNFPQSPKTPGALLKQGYCLFEQRQYADAKVFLNKVIVDYPKSDEAGEALERVKKIDQILASPIPPAKP